MNSHTPSSKHPAQNPAQAGTKEHETCSPLPDRHRLAFWQIDSTHHSIARQLTHALCGSHCAHPEVPVIGASSGPAPMIRIWATIC